MPCAPPPGGGGAGSLEGRRPGPCILRGPLRGHLRMTEWSRNAGRRRRERRAPQAVYTAARADYAKAQSNPRTGRSIMAGETKALAQFAAGLRYEDIPAP